MNIKEQIKRLKRNIPAIYLALKHKETPKIAKLVAAIIIVYALSPVDLIPDFIPIIGLLDDLIIIPLLIKLFIVLIPKDLFIQYQNEAEHLWDNGKPKKWYFAIPFVLAWIFMVYVVVTIFI